MLTSDEINEILDYLTYEVSIDEVTHRLGCYTLTDDIDDAQDVLTDIREQLQEIGYKIHDVDIEHDFVGCYLVKSDAVS